MNEIRIYSGIEAIGWDVGVSEPAKPRQKNVEQKLDSIFGSYEEKNSSQ